jgi:hypothetical protein
VYHRKKSYSKNIWEDKYLWNCHTLVSQHIKIDKAYKVCGIWQKIRWWEISVSYVEKQVWVLSLILFRKVEVEHFISKKTHTPITLRFWVNMQSLSHFWGEYLTFRWVLDPMWMIPPHDDPSVVSEPGSSKGSYLCVKSLPDMVVRRRVPLKWPWRDKWNFGVVRVQMFYSKSWHLIQHCYSYSKTVKQIKTQY